MTESIQKLYDSIPYNDDPVRATNLIHLATVGRLFGLASVDPNKSRVLELGCAKGGNLMSLAYMHPQSTFIGIDISKNQIDTGIAVAEEAEIKNLELRQANIEDVSSSWGTFDYIIAHGILSWVPNKVQEQIFKIFKNNLSKNGIGYLSYNTYPGWHSRETLREYMLVEAAKHSSPPDKVKAAREILFFLQKCLEGDESPTSKAYLQEIPQMVRMPDWYFIHDFLSETNNPFYFHQILSKLDEYELQYLGDSELASMVLSNVRPTLQGMLKKAAPDLGRLEHFLDFSTNRMFRRTLICKADQKLQRPVNPKALFESSIASSLSPSHTRLGEKIRFSHHNGGAIDSSDERFQRFLIALSSKWPTNAPFGSLLAEIGVDQREPKAMEIAEQVLRCIFANLIEISFYPHRFTKVVSEKPLASRLARTQAKLRLPITSLRHEVVGLSDIEREVLIKLDGQTSISKIERANDVISTIAAHGLLEAQKSL